MLRSIIHICRSREPNLIDIRAASVDVARDLVFVRPLQCPFPCPSYPPLLSPKEGPLVVFLILGPSYVLYSCFSGINDT